jgi:hypothetical protein
MPELNMENRDPNGMNAFIQVQFDDVLAEPEGAHSADCVWENAYKCFNCGFGCIYKLWTYCCGICYGLFWGWIFACIAIKVIWIITPGMRALHIILHPIRKLISILLGSKDYL